MRLFAAAGVRAVLLATFLVVVGGATHPALSAEYEELVAQANNVDRVLRWSAEQFSPAKSSRESCCWWSMIFSENRYPLFGIMLS
jgi:hypothetical protein